MSTMYGMDISQVRALAQLMSHTASEIQQMTANLTSNLQNTPWVGPDRQSFESDWHSTHVMQLNQVVNALNDAATRANNNATEQENVSQSG